MLMTFTLETHSQNSLDASERLIRLNSLALPKLLPDTQHLTTFESCLSQKGWHCITAKTHVLLAILV